MITLKFTELLNHLLLSLWLYSSNFGLGRLHETFRFISVTRSRTVSSTPWTDQLVTRALLTAPGDYDGGEVGGMNGFGRGNRNTRRKHSPNLLCPPQIPLARPGHEPGPRGRKPANSRFSCGAAINDLLIEYFCSRMLTVRG
jgi:hypothetical protein